MLLFGFSGSALPPVASRLRSRVGQSSFLRVVRPKLPFAQEYALFSLLVLQRSLSPLDVFLLPPLLPCCPLFFAGRAFPYSKKAICRKKKQLVYPYSILTSGGPIVPLFQRPSAWLPMGRTGSEANFRPCGRPRWRWSASCGRECATRKPNRGSSKWFAEATGVSKWVNSLKWMCFSFSSLF